MPAASAAVTVTVVAPLEIATGAVFTPSAVFKNARLLRIGPVTGFDNVTWLPDTEATTVPGGTLVPLTYMPGTMPVEESTVTTLAPEAAYANWDVFVPVGTNTKSRDASAERIDHAFAAPVFVA